MLQINTGKMFSRGIGRTNNLTGVLYSNARLPHGRNLTTDAGTLRGTGSGPADLALVYELEERIEDENEGPGVLISHTIGPYLDDFAVVASFGLGAIFSRDPAIIRSLTDGRPSFGFTNSTANFIDVIFDQSVHLDDKQLDRFQAFVTDLLALERRYFLGAMDAMRTFVGGLHRISDNLGQAYTMMVSAVESLAQGFDGFDPIWTDLADHKRRSIDAALNYVNAETAKKVREAILKQEHVALGRRYRQFTLAHLGQDFKRRVQKSERSIASYELEPAIAQAYKLRSKYIHRLKALPTSISHPHAHCESTTVDREPALTFQGLYNVTDAVIRSFVARSPKIDCEEYNYRLERAGVVSINLAPQYWVWKPVSHPKEARRRLEGQLSLTAQALIKAPNAQLTDVRPALEDIVGLLPQAKQEHRPAMLAFYFLANLMVPIENRSEGFDEFFDVHHEEAELPSVESLVVATVLGRTDNWSLASYEQNLAEYFTQRVKKSGLHAPRVLEAAMCITLAEKFRQAGDVAKAKSQILRAIGVSPGNNALKELNDNAISGPLEWRTILLPRGEVESVKDKTGKGRAEGQLKA